MVCGVGDRPEVLAKHILVTNSPRNHDLIEGSEELRTASMIGPNCQAPNLRHRILNQGLPVQDAAGSGLPEIIPSPKRRLVCAVGRNMSHCILRMN